MSERVQVVLMGLSLVVLGFYGMHNLGKRMGFLQKLYEGFGARHIIFREAWKFQMVSMVLFVLLGCVVLALGNADRLGVLAGMLLLADALIIGPWALGVKDGVRLAHRYCILIQEIGPDVQPIQCDSPVF